MRQEEKLSVRDKLWGPDSNPYALHKPKPPRTKRLPIGFFHYATDSESGGGSRRSSIGSDNDGYGVQGAHDHLDPHHQRGQTAGEYTTRERAHKQEEYGQGDPRVDSFGGHQTARF